MSSHRPRVCAEPGCPVLTHTTYCPAHTPAEPPRPNSHARGYDRHWRRLSATILRRRTRCECRDPECGACPGHDCPRVSTDVDHRTPVRYFALRRAADTPTNLIALCHQCHSSKTARHDTPR